MTMEHIQATHKIAGPHQGQSVLASGEPLQRAKAAMIMLHGRGASAEDILSLATELNQSGFLYLAPQAAGYSWYPNSFLAPLASNEPGISSGLAVIASLFEHLADAIGITQQSMRQFRTQKAAQRQVLFRRDRAE